MRGVKEDVKNLSRKLSSIKAVLVDAENKQVNNPQLKEWLEKVKEKAFDAEDELETFAAEASLWKKRHSALLKDNAFSFSEHTRHVSLLGKDVKKSMLAIVKNAQKLRTLLLPNGHMESFDQALDKLSHMLPPSMGNLTSLHNLPVFQVGDENGYEIKQLKKMSHLSGTLHISKLEKAVNAGEAKLNEKKSLHKLVFEWSDRVVNTQDEATDNNLLEDLQPPSNLRELHVLRYRGNEFPAWVKEGLLQNLVILTLRGCIKCKTLALGQLPNLGELYVKGQRETVDVRHSFNELLELKVLRCPKLQALPQFFSPQKLEISRCELLTTLPPHSRRLHHLALDGCEDGALVRAIRETGSLNSLVISSISNISSLPKWPQLPGLKSLNCEKLETLNEELPTSLECLTIASCPLLKSFSLKSLPSLADLYIEDCPLLQSLPEDGFPSSLQHLLIKTCPLLTQRCQNEGGGGPDWPKIEHIPDLEIDSSHRLVPSTSL
ncbi:hypothetical protein FH972_009875 [Carpinus fangiana]|uniref:Uncharacterized protein n=1 Tax=Carpinus fangiana TaxID=176857 RepID=A0A660KN84_9ROSI|nr:hypothetical protein FH972_009875 [Carpinus fangiana]